MHEHGCSGQCAVGVILAIIFGAFFVWTLVIGYQTQLNNLYSMSSFLVYVVALVFMALAKIAKQWAHGCGCRGEAAEKPPQKRRKK